MAKAGSGFAPYALSLLRLIAGFMYSLHGFQKLFGMFGGFGPHGVRVQVLTRSGLAGVLELVGGILICAGLLTRPVAFILSGEMAAAYFLVHIHRGSLPINNGGELAALYSFLFLFLAAAGAGPLSLDRLRGKA